MFACLEFILAQLFVIPICSYFDDFPLVAFEQVAMELFEVVLEVFTLLGWSVKHVAARGRTSFEHAGNFHVSSAG